MKYILIVFIFPPYICAALEFKQVPDGATNIFVNQTRWNMIRSLSRHFNKERERFTRSFDADADVATSLNAYRLFKDNVFKVFDVYVNRSGPTIDKLNSFIGWWRLHYKFEQQLWTERCQNIGLLINKPSLVINEHYSTRAQSYYECPIKDNIFVD